MAKRTMSIPGVVGSIQPQKERLRNNFGDSMIQCGEKDVLAQRVDFVVDHGDDGPPYNLKPVLKTQKF